eukprot:CAMPEP_0114174190 /NCGR_PEP_ID=MMETSP0043_2-20121206/36256_1 /TAXON_ID=464988 /ORGANISM="Hemiselmis andersenii, Strain CCMP644" /LENGTH=110 /DNA_ID=CAMNT_0001272275 /DNA_START=1 /DNA_END=330 /DNA_ORIENTATION=+
MQEKRRGDLNAPLKCIECVEKAQALEREAAAQKRAQAAASGEGSGGEAHVCSACKEEKPALAFNKTQLNKGEGKQRCQECVAKAETEAANAGKAKLEEEIASAREALKKA